MGGRGSSNNTLVGIKKQELKSIKTFETNVGINSLFYINLAGITKEHLNSNSELSVQRAGDLVTVELKGSTSIIADVHIKRRDVDNVSISGSGKDLRDKKQKKVLDRSTYRLNG